MRFYLILVNIAAGVLALVVSFAYLTGWGKVARLTDEPRAGETFRDTLTTPARQSDTECESDSLGVALSSLAQAANRQSEPTPETPAPLLLSDLTKLALRYESVDHVERTARKTALRRVGKLCQDSLGDKQRLRLSYNVRLQGRKAAFDLSDSVVEQGAPLTPDLARCLETVASHLDVDLEARFQDLPSFQGSTAWSFVVGNLRRLKSGNAPGNEKAPELRAP